jgi:hypothetical protein
MSEDKHKRVTKAQFDIWIDSPVTKVYLQCLKWSAEQAEEIAGNGSLIDSSNNDLSMNHIHGVMGQKTGLITASNPELLLNTHKLLEEEEAE